MGEDQEKALSIPQRQIHWKVSFFKQNNLHIKGLISVINRVSTRNFIAYINVMLFRYFASLLYLTQIDTCPACFDIVLTQP